MTPVVLASTSQVRAALLTGAGVAHQAVGSGVDEDEAKRRLLASGHERRVEGRQQPLEGAAHLATDGSGRSWPQPSSERRFDVGPDVVGVPEGRANARRLAAAGDDGRRRQIGRVRLENVDVFGAHAIPHLVETAEQMVGAVIRTCGPFDSNDSRPPSPRIGWGPPARLLT